MLVGLRVGVDADDVGGRSGEHLRAVALAAGQVDDRSPATALGDPLVDGEVAPVPVVLLGHVGKRPLAGQLERRHALGLVLLYVGAHGGRDYQLAPMAAAPTATAEHIKDVNTRYHDAAAARLRLEVGHRLRRHRPGPGRCEAREGARRRAATVRRRARDRLRHRLLLAQPRPAGADRAPRRPTSPRGCCDARRHGRRRSAST